MGSTNTFIIRVVFLGTCTDNRVLGLEVEADKMGQVSISIIKKIHPRLYTPIMVSFDPVKTKRNIFLSPDLGHIGLRR